MSKEVKILVIVEGTRTEPTFFEQLASVYGVNAKIYSVGTNIYLLYKKMQEYEFQCDVKDALSELTVTKADKELLKETFTYTYLIFDCDAHHTDFLDKDKPLETVVKENFRHLQEMAAHFTNETDPSIGKLYINYPMMESYKDCDAFFDEAYKDRTVDVSDFVRYKSIITQKKIANVRMDRYTKENFDDLTRMNVYKLNYIRRDLWDAVSYDTYLELSEASEIVFSEEQFCDTTHQVQVLNTALFLLLDYYGNRDGFFDRLMRRSDPESDFETDDEKIDRVAREILNEYRHAFEELAKG